MSDEKKRIIDQPTVTTLSTGDLIIIDSEESGVGTRKFDLGAELTDIKQDLQDIIEGGVGGGGVPKVVDTIAKMTDQAQIYVYGGNESGYTAGDWYFYSSAVQSWVSGGVYCGVSSSDLQQALRTFLANNSTILTNADTTAY